MKGKFIFLGIFAFILLSSSVFAQNVSIDFFYSSTCPHCHAEMKFLDQYQAEHPELHINYYEVYSGIKENEELFKQRTAEFNASADSVPRTFIGDKMFVGFTEETGLCKEQNGGYLGYQNQIEIELDALLGLNEHQCEVVTQDINLLKNALYILILPLIIFFILFAIFRKTFRKRYWISSLISLIVILLFVFTKSIPAETLVNQIQNYPMPLFTFIIGLLDGFNPCAMFVLSFLLAILVYTNSRKKMVIIGLTFIITSGVMYFLYMLIILGVLNTPIFESNKFILRLVIGVIALIAGGINLKEFFAFKKGISLTIPDKYKPGIFKRMRGIVNQIKETDNKKALFFGVIATILLAAFINIIELACTLFLPLIYTSILTQNISNFAGQVFYIFLYNIFYVIPLLGIFFAFIYSMKSHKLTKKQGRILKLIGGLLMVILGLILLFRPELLLFA